MQFKSPATRRGTAVLFGMMGVTCFGLLFTPAFAKQATPKWPPIPALRIVKKRRLALEWWNRAAAACLRGAKIDARDKDHEQSRSALRTDDVGVPMAVTSECRNSEAVTTRACKRLADRPHS
jgi:hypothetical protein